MKTTALFFVLFNAVFVAVLTDQSLDEVPELQFVEPDPDLEKYLREAIENFREQMKVGIEAIKMPVLDPLELKNLDINVLENLATLDLKIRKPKVSHLSNFNITNLKANLEEFYLEMNLTLPAIYIDGEYSANGKLAKIFPVYGKGQFDINATDIRMFGIGKLGFTTDTMEMALIKLDFDWKDISIYMENFLGGGNFAEVLQKVLPKIGRDIFHLYKPLMMEKVEKYLTEKVNSKLDDQDVKDIIRNIIPKQ
ncbi:uncharacterized protein [Parasteatoda tepidariorum]|uniref:uncharacterized protein isoform X2 n=1 Tax=Parasteatoda tepidariorum TaxID=114398 RepID=UPI001C725557|nr:uncharacterized protein LOC107437106 isoform X2 [Parasteatoda tepidariorum]